MLRHADPGFFREEPISAAAYIAAHETGHAAACMIFGIPIRYVESKPGTVEGICVYSSDFDANLQPLVSMAGLAGERILIGRDWGGHTPAHLFRSEAQTPTRSAPANVRLVPDLDTGGRTAGPGASEADRQKHAQDYAATMQLLMEPYRQRIDTIARTLAACSRLSGDEVALLWNAFDLAAHTTRGHFKDRADLLQRKRQAEATQKETAFTKEAETYKRALLDYASRRRLDGVRILPNQPNRKRQ